MDTCMFFGLYRGQVWCEGGVAYGYVEVLGR